MLQFKRYEQGITFYLHLIFLIEHAFCINAQYVEAVISVQIQNTSTYSTVVDIRNDIYSKFQENLFSNKNSTIILKYQGEGNRFYVTTLIACDDQNQRENPFYTCFVNESIMSVYCRRDMSCSIQNCTSCNTGTGIRWIYNGYLSSKYISNKTEHCDDGQELVMYTMVQNCCSISTSTTSSNFKTVSETSTTTPNFITVNIKETSANITLPESSSEDVAGVIAGVTVSVIVVVIIAVLIFFIWRKRNSKTDSNFGNNSQNMGRQNNNYVRSPENVLVRDIKKDTNNKPISSTTYLDQSSNNLNNDSITMTIKSETETPIYTGIDDDILTAQLNVFNSDYEKSNSLDNYTTARISNEHPDNSTCTLSNENDYNVIDYSQGETKFRDSKLETSLFDDGYSSVDEPREITSSYNADSSPDIQSTGETIIDECSQVNQHSYNHKTVSNYMNLPNDIENTTQNQRNVYSKLRENISKFKDTYGDSETLAQEDNDHSQPSDTETYFTLDKEEDVSSDIDKNELVD